MRTKPRFQTIDTADFTQGRMPVWNESDGRFVPGTGGSGGGVSPQGDWSHDTDYFEGDIVTHDGSSYICIADHHSKTSESGGGSESGTDDEPDVGNDWETYWQLLAEKGADGAQGEAGANGADGADGADGEQGPQGLKGDPGEGVPTGGTTGQVLAKSSGTDYDTEWIDPPEGGESGSGGGLSAVVDDTTPVLGGELDADTNKIINLGAPTNNNDAATKKYVDDNAGGGGGGSVDIRDVWLFA